MSYMVHIMTSNTNSIKNCDREMTAKKKPFWNKLKKKKKKFNVSGLLFRKSSWKCLTWRQQL